MKTSKHLNEYLFELTYEDIEEAIKKYILRETPDMALIRSIHIENAAVLVPTMFVGKILN